MDSNQLLDVLSRENVPTTSHHRVSLGGDLFASHEGRTATPIFETPRHHRG